MRETCTEVYLLLACPAVGVAVTLNGVVVYFCYVSAGCRVPVCRLAKIEQHCCRVGGVGIALDAATLRCGQLNINVIAVKVYLVISGLALLALMAEHGVYAQWSICNLKRVGHRHKADVVEITGSGAAQVCMAEPGDGAVGVEISCNPVPSGLSVVGTQLYHSEWRLCTGVYVTLVVSTYKRVYKRRIVGIFLLWCVARK